MTDPDGSHHEAISSFGEDPNHAMPEEAALLLLFILFGLLIAQLCEIILHRYHIYAIPGSGAGEF